MLLALDLGNTSLTGGVFDGEKLLRRFRTRVSDFGDVTDRLKDDVGDFPHGNIHCVALASVNPPWVYAVQGAVRALLPDAEFVMVGRDVKVPIKVRVDRREEVGVDRLLNVRAAFRRVGGACLVVDFGSALTVDVVSTRGEYLGGVIAPGTGMSAAALHAGTALLPEVKPDVVDVVTGKDTITCIRSGLFWGAISMVEGLVRRLKEEHPDVEKVLATGGDAGIFAPHTTVMDEVIPELTLEGIRLTVESERAG